jgi:phosphomannomutase/phosphoglucomutase
MFPDTIAGVLRICSLLAIGTGLFAIVAGGAFLYIGLAGQLELERAEGAAERKARRLSDRIDLLRDALRDPSVIELARSLASGESEDIEALRQALVDGGFGNLVEVRVVPGATTDIALRERDDLDFAALETVLEASGQGAADVRVHDPGTAEETLAFAQALPGDEGVIFARTTVNMMTSALQASERLDYLALVQGEGSGRVILRAIGSRQGGGQRSLPIDGSRLELAWYKGVVSAGISGRDAFIILATGVIILMGGLLIRRRTPLARHLEREHEASGVIRHEPPIARSDSGIESGGGRTAAPVAPRGEATRDTPGESDSLDAGAEPIGDTGTWEGDQTQEVDLPDLPAWLEESESRSLEELVGDGDSAEESELPGTAAGVETGSWFESHEQLTGIDTDMFTADGLHGDRLDPALAEITGRAVGSEMQARGVDRAVTGRDGRHDSAEQLTAFIRGLNQAGIDVLNLDIAALPVIGAAAERWTGGSAAWIGGGHLPFSHAGIQFMLEGVFARDEDWAGIRRRIENDAFESGQGIVESREFRTTYIDQLAADAKLERPLKVVVDCGNGASAMVLPEAYERLGAEVVVLHGELDDVQAGHDPDPAEAANLEDLRLSVRSVSADLGLAFDSEGSRLGVVAEDGKILSSDVVLMLLAGVAGSRESGGVVVTDGLVSGVLDPWLQRSGAETVRFGGGRASLQARSREDGVMLAGSSTGHFFFGLGWQPTDDAIRAGARLLALVDSEKQPIGRLAARLPVPRGGKPLVIEIEQEIETFLDELRERGKDFGFEARAFRGGVILISEEGRAAVQRGTRLHEILIGIETEGGADPESLRERVQALVSGVHPELTLPA